MDGVAYRRLAHVVEHLCTSCTRTLDEIALPFPPVPTVPQRPGVYVRQEAVENGIIRFVVSERYQKTKIRILRFRHLRRLKELLHHVRLRLVGDLKQVFLGLHSVLVHEMP